MQAITLRDVSREAGVSLATADRVTNGRPGVRAATVARVRDAIERLGYQANPLASRLARGGTRFAFLLPRGSNPFMAALSAQTERLQQHFASELVSVEIIPVDPLEPASQAEALARAGRDGFDGVALVAMEHAAVQAAVDRLVATGLPVVTLVSDLPGSRRDYYVGIDNLAAGRTAGSLLGRFVGPRAGLVGVVLGSAALSDHADRLRGFTDVLAREFAGLALLPPETGQDDEARSAAAASRLLDRHPALVGLYVAGAGAPGVAAALHASGRARDVVLVGHELDDRSTAWLRDGVIDALIHQDAGHEARSAVRLLLARLTGSPVLPEQERIRIEIFLRDNLPATVHPTKGSV